MRVKPKAYREKKNQRKSSYADITGTSQTAISLYHHGAVWTCMGTLRRYVQSQVSKVQVRKTTNV